MTSKTPATKQKNPKRVAAGKAVAQKKRNRHARRRKRALIAAQSIIANGKVKNVDPPPVAVPVAQPVAESVAEPPQVESTKNDLTTTQWLSVISILVSLAGIYYKCEEIKSFLTKKLTVNAVPRAPPPSPVDAVSLHQREKGASDIWIKKINCTFL